MTVSVTVTNWGDEIVYENRGGIERFFAPDTLGSTALLVDPTGTVTDTFTYWPYGELVSHTGTSSTTFTYVGTLGYYFDSVVNWFYIRARYLRQTLARWQTVDPLWPFTSAYKYVANSPVLFSDSSGLAHWLCDHKHFPFFCDWVWSSMPYSTDRDLQNFIECVDNTSASCNWAAPQGTTSPSDALRSIFQGGPGDAPSFNIEYGGTSGVCNESRCAFTNILTKPPTITICKSGLNPGRCGSLAYVILHELIHATGAGHNSVNDPAWACLKTNFGCDETISESSKH